MDQEPNRSSREARRARARAEWREFWQGGPEDGARASFEERWRDTWREHRRTRGFGGRGTPRFMRGIGCIFGLLILSAAFSGGILTALAARAPERGFAITAAAALVA